MEAFEQLEVWKRSSRLCVNVYKVLRSCPDKGFKDQITRAALSIPSNIAEGHERNSRAEYRRFLKIAKGSCGELRTQLYIGSEVGFLEKRRAAEYINESIHVIKMIQGLINSLARPER